MSLFLNQIWGNVALHQCLINGCSAVNGCRQNESLMKTSQHSSPSVNILIKTKAETNPALRWFLTKIRVYDHNNTSLFRVVLDCKLCLTFAYYMNNILIIDLFHSDGTHSLQMIHWRDTDAVLHFPKSDEETNS